MEQENQKVEGGEVKTETKSKKGLYVVVAVVAVLLIGSWISKNSMKAVTGVDVDKNIDGSATYTTKEGSVSVGTNKLPADWPSDAPTYKNATIQYSASTNPQTGGAGLGVVFMTSDSSQIVIDFYKKELVAKGWTIEQTAIAGQTTVISAKKDDRQFGMYIADAENGQTSVTVSISSSK